jgi:uncharacterized membrane protein YbhN (UPF0104 family)
MYHQPSMILQPPSHLTLRKLCGRARRKSVALFSCATASSTHLTGFVVQDGLIFYGLIVIQKAKYYVCEYSPAGNVIGEFA